MDKITASNLNPALKAVEAWKELEKENKADAQALAELFDKIPGFDIEKSQNKVSSLLPEDKAYDGQKLALSTEVQSLEGSDKNDKITATVTTSSKTTTLLAKDSIDAKGGDLDTLEVAVAGNFSGFAKDAGVKNVEIISLKNTSNTSQNFKATGIKGAKKLVIDSGENKKALNVSGVENSLDIEFKNFAGSSINLDSIYSSDVKKALTNGKSDSQLLVLDGVGAFESKDAKGKTVAQKEVSIVANGVETLKLDLIKDAVVKDISNESVIAKGAAALKITTKDGVKVLDASGVDGGVEADLTADAAKLQVVKTGAGNDLVRLKVDAKALVATEGSSLDLGAGNDTVVLTLGSGGAKEPSLKSVEKVVLTGGSTAKTTLSLLNASETKTLVNQASEAVEIVNANTLSELVLEGTTASKSTSVFATNLSKVSLNTTTAQTLTANASTGFIYSFEKASTDSVLNATALKSLNLVDNANGSVGLNKYDTSGTTKKGNLTALESLNITGGDKTEIELGSDIGGDLSSKLDISLSGLKSATLASQTSGQGDIQSSGNINIKADSISSTLTLGNIGTLKEGAGIAINADIATANLDAANIKSEGGNLELNLNANSVTTKDLSGNSVLANINAKDSISLGNSTTETSILAKQAINLNLNSNGNITVAKAITSKEGSIELATKTLGSVTLNKAITASEGSISLNLNAAAVTVAEAITAKGSINVVANTLGNTLLKGALKASEVNVDFSKAISNTHIKEIEANEVSYKAGITGNRNDDGSATAPLALKALNAQSFAASLYGGVGSDKFVITKGAGAAELQSIVVKGDLGYGDDDKLTIGATTAAIDKDSSKVSEIDLSGFNSASEIFVAATKTGDNALNILGGAGDDTVTVKNTGASLVLKGDLGGGTNTLTISSIDGTATTLTTVDLSELSNYVLSDSTKLKTATGLTSVKLGNGNDDVTFGKFTESVTISTGAGEDSIKFGAIADGKSVTLELGEGGKTIDVSAAVAKANAETQYVEISGIKTGDKIKFADDAADGAVIKSSKASVADMFGASSDLTAEFKDKENKVYAFEKSGDTYLLYNDQASDGGSNVVATDILVKLTGVKLDSFNASVVDHTLIIG